MIYVGDFKYVPKEIFPISIEWILKCHPRDFDKVKKELDRLAQFKFYYYTNNPYLVDYFDYDKVMVCGEKGVRKLSEHPKYEGWKEEMNAGEFWSMVGENW